MTGLQLKYFVLKPRGTDEYAEASRKAIQTYAAEIKAVDWELARELEEWAFLEQERALSDG